MVKITGLDKLQRELREAERAFEEVDGKLGTVTFDPHDPSSIEAAMSTINQLIDERVGTYSSNSIVGPMAEEMKAKYREALLEKAAAARLGGDQE